MTKAMTTERQEAVQVSRVDDMTYVYIYLNEKEVKRESIDENESETLQYEYDYNEIKGKTADIDIDEITKNPEKYMNVSVIEAQKEETPAMPNLEERVSAIEEMLIAEMGGEEA